MEFVLPWHPTDDTLTFCLAGLDLQANALALSGCHIGQIYQDVLRQSKCVQTENCPVHFVIL